jgi:AcrR family transcriptional regulator
MTYANTPSSRGPGRPARLSRDQVIEAALETADAGGLEALTMQNIARHVGAEAMSLYRHVANKDEILDAIVDRVYAEIVLPTEGADWRLTMRERAVSTRDALRRHPWAISLMESRRRPGPANLRQHDRMVGILLDAGYSAATATHIYNVIDSYVYGFALQEESLPFDTAEELAEVGAEILAAVDADEYPHLVTVSAGLLEAGFDYGAEFEVGLDLVLDAVARLRPDAAVIGPGSVSRRSGAPANPGSSGSAPARASGSRTRGGSTRRGLPRG